MWQLRDDSLAELVTGVAVGKREGDMGVQALQLPRIARAADAEVERRAHVGAGAGGRELAADGALLLRRVLQAMGELGIVGDPSLQRSTPPAASTRETAATRCGHVR